MTPKKLETPLKGDQERWKKKKKPFQNFKNHKVPQTFQVLQNGIIILRYVSTLLTRRSIFTRDCTQCLNKSHCRNLTSQDTPSVTSSSSPRRSGDGDLIPSGNSPFLPESALPLPSSTVTSGSNRWTSPNVTVGLIRSQSLLPCASFRSSLLKLVSKTIPSLTTKCVLQNIQ